MTEFDDLLARSVLDGRGLAGIAEALHQHLEQPVRIWSGAGETLAGAPAEFAATDVEWCRSEVRHGNLDVVVGACERGGAPGVEDRALLERATLFAALELYRMRSVADVELKAMGDLTSAILDDDDPERVATLAASLGLDIGQDRRVIVVQPEARGGDVERLRTDARALDGDAMVTTRDDHAVLIVKDHIDWSAFRRSLDTKHDSVRVGASSPGRVSDGLARALKEARLALRVSKAVDGPRLTYFDDLGLYRLLANADPQEVEQHIDEWLGPVIEHDRARNSELLRTLTEYFERGSSLDQTARALCIHRSTLKYRLQRAATLLDRDLSDADTRFNLHVATRALATMRAIRDSDESGPDDRDGDR
jgi:DNA-binding PucR family transcriptional regulator